MSTTRNGGVCWARFGMTVLGGCILLGIMGVGLLQGQGKKPPLPSPAILPEGLRHVPVDAAGFVHVRIGAVLKTDAGKSALKLLVQTPMFAGIIDEAQKQLGLRLSDVDSVTLVFLEPPLGLGRGESKAKVADAPTESNQQKSVDSAPPKFEEKKPSDKKFDDPKPEDMQPEAFHPVSFQVPQHDHDHHVQEFGPASGIPAVIVSTTVPYNRKKLLQRFVLNDNEDGHDHGGRDVSVLFLSDHSFMVGMPFTLLRYQAHVSKTPATTPLRSMLALGAKEHLVVAGGRPEIVGKMLMHNIMHRHGDVPAPVATFFPLLHLASAGLTLDLDQGARLNLHLDGTNARSAALAQQALQAGLDVADLELEKVLGAADKKQREPLSAVTKELIGKLRKTLASAKIGPDENSSRTILVKLDMDMEPATLAAVLGELAGQVKKASYRTQSMNNLKQIALAMHNYHDVYKGFPPAGLTSIKDAAGKPLLSWRVAILPYIEAQGLYQQFDLNLPWDHPHNKKLIEQMPPIYVVPGATTKAPGMTHYQVFVGPGTVFEPRKDRKGNANMRMIDILDGTSNTLMVVEAAEPVIWTKPDDLVFNPKGPLPKLGGHFGNGFHAAFCDGHVRFIPGRVEEKILRLLIMRDDGQAVPFDF